MEFDDILPDLASSPRSSPRRHPRSQVRPMGSPSAIPSSSPANFLPSPPRSSSSRRRGTPSITPRRFGRFFTPRAGRAVPFQPQRSALGEMTASAMNRQLDEPMPDAPVEGLGAPFSPSFVAKAAVATTPASSQADESRKRPLDSSPIRPAKRMPPPFTRTNSLDSFFTSKRGSTPHGKSKLPSTLTDVPIKPSVGVLDIPDYQPQPMIKVQNRGLAAHLLIREEGCMARPGLQRIAHPVCDPRIETANFYSSSADLHICNGYSGSGLTMPFSLSSCHTTPLTAIGDEEGYVRLFSTSGRTPEGESNCDVSFQPHSNAIMDLSFSTDDFRLATACGDRTGKVIDVMSQRVAVELAGAHTHSMRRVEFQPGAANGNVLATSDRDGTIQIWDLRVPLGPTHHFSTVDTEGRVERPRHSQPFYAKTVNTIHDAHARTVDGVSSSASVTAIQWFPAGREHLLLSASEAKAVVKLWDSRYIKPRRQPEATPVCCTVAPSTHQWRTYGITSLALSTDAARLYAVCKDNTVYAYSVPHMMLGHAPELSENPPRRRQGQANEGLGPLYGFKDDHLRVETFFVKCAVRPRNINGTELLAVGSSSHCAVLFPTDERFLWDRWDRDSHQAPNLQQTECYMPDLSMTRSLRSSGGGLRSLFFDATTMPSAVPIVRNGVPLIRGHSREVTTVDWSNEGKLLTSSDDCIVRYWQEDRHRATELRTCGEFGGRRHMSGWADVGDDWDAEEDEDE